MNNIAQRILGGRFGLLPRLGSLPSRPPQVRVRGRSRRTIGPTLTVRSRDGKTTTRSS